MFSCEFCEIFKNTCFTEHLRATASARGVLFCKNLGKNLAKHLCDGFLVEKKSWSIFFQEFY